MTDQTEDAAVQTCENPEKALPIRRRRPHRDTVSKLQAVRLLADSGMAQRDIARRMKMTERTVSSMLHDVGYIMQAEGVSVAMDWRSAIKKAATRGRHEPAKDWLLHAKLIEPVQDKAQTGIQILIGQVGTVGVLPGMPGAKVLETAPEMVQIGDSTSVSAAEPATCEDGST